MEQRNNLGCRFTSWIALFFEKDSTNVTSRIFTRMNKNRDSRFLAERNAHFHLQRSGTKHKYVLTKILKKVFFIVFVWQLFFKKKFFPTDFVERRKSKENMNEEAPVCITAHYIPKYRVSLVLFPSLFFQKRIIKFMGFTEQEIVWLSQSICIDSLLSTLHRNCIHLWL